MRTSAFISLAFTALVAARPTQDSIPNLPDGWFTGYNHANGTNTLIFHEHGQSFNFKPLAPAEAGVLSKRSGSSCWTGASFPKLPQAGTDAGIQQWRIAAQDAPEWAGNGGSACNSQYPPYVGYNNGGVYVYFCYNSNDSGSDSCDFNDVQTATSNMDQTCGSYVPGYYQWDSPSLFGKCASGTAVCLGNSRS